MDQMDGRVGYVTWMSLACCSLFSDSADFGGTTLMNLLSSLFLGQLVHVIGNGDSTLLNVSLAHFPRYLLVNTCYSFVSD